MADLLSFAPAIAGLMTLGGVVTGSAVASVAMGVFPQRQPATNEVRKFTPPVRTRAAFDFGEDRFLADFLKNVSSPKREHMGSATELRYIGRALEVNSPQVRSVIISRQVNIFGHQGIRLESQIKKRNGELDTDRNDKIESLWRKWCRRENCSADGQLSFARLIEMVDTRRFIDGGVLIRKAYKTPGSRRFHLQVLEVDQLDSGITRTLANGNQIDQGIEYDKWGAVRAYWIRNYSPSDRVPLGGQRRTDRVDAAEVIYFAKFGRPGQLHGMSEMAAAVLGLRHLDKYQEAELLASRSAANYFGVIQSAGQEVTDPVLDENGMLVEAPEQESLSPGILKRLLPGETFQGFSPNRPNSAFVEFWRSIQRSIASALGLSYESLSSDYSQSNFSSTRQSLISERDYWRLEQQRILEVLQKIWEWWIESALIMGDIDASHYFSHEEEYLCPRWITRTWDWVDPTKDVTAVISAIDNGLSTLTDEIAKQGGDIEEVARKRAAEKKLEEKYDIIFSKAQTSSAQDTQNESEQVSNQK